MKDLTEEIDIVFGTLIGGWEQEEVNTYLCLLILSLLNLNLISTCGF